jgi:serine/threonine-protein kinase
MRIKKGSVLCVDDEPNILRSLHWMLHRDFDVMTAPNGHAALDMLRKHDFDVIVSDQRMPGMIGSELLREARKQAPRAMRILLTGYSDMQAILRSINEGEVFRFVNKPWSNEELTNTVAEAALIAKTQPPPAPQAETEAPPPRGDCILLLDEDPQMAAMLTELIGPDNRLCHAHSVAEAVAILGTEPVSVLVSDTLVGRVDTTPLVKMLKHRHPDIVSIVLTVDSDVDAVIKLINQGQVYRFIPKPVKAGYLKIMLSSAAQKHRELKSDPGRARRHAVEVTSAQNQEKLVEEVWQEAARIAPRSAVGGAASFLERIGGGLKRLFAAAGT